MSRADELVRWKGREDYTRSDNLGPLDDDGGTSRAQATKIIKELENPWISCKDRLPQDGYGTYLINPNNYADNIHQVNVSNGAWVRKYFERGEITHWMPIPRGPDK